MNAGSRFLHRLLALALCAAAPAAHPQSRATITIDPGVQASSGIETQVLAAAAHAPEVAAYGLAIDPKPLVELSARYGAAQGEHMAAQAALEASGQEYRRLERLNQQDHNVSDRRVQAARAAWQTDQARLQAAVRATRALQQAASAEWGGVLARWALADSPSLAALTSGREALIQVVLPPALRAADAPSLIMLQVPGTQARTEQARLISASPRADSAIQGETFFYRVPRGSLRIGMRIVAHVPVSREALQGVVIPEQAVIWYANRRWAYVQIDPGHFARRALAEASRVPGGWFAIRGWRPGERVVVRGAQLIYAQEFGATGVLPPGKDAD